MITRTPFETTRLEEERQDDKGRVFTVRLNEKDLDVFNELKILWGLEEDNKAIRAAIYWARNVTQTQFGSGLNELLFKKKRLR